jgi:hypothetical protein
MSDSIIADQQQLESSIITHHIKYEKDFLERHGVTLKEMQEYIDKLKAEKMGESKAIKKQKTAPLKN